MRKTWQLPFFTIWTGQAFSLLGSHLVKFALIWWLTESTGSAAVLATATTMGMLPTILLGPFAGTLIDRLKRKWVLILSDASTALFTVLLGLLFWLGIAQPWHVFLTILLRAVGDAFQNPTMMTTTAMMVPKEQLSRVAAMNQALQGILGFVAPGLGALLLALAPMQGILALDVVTAIIAIAPLFFVAVPQPAPRAKRMTPRSFLADTGFGFRYIWDYRGLRHFVGTGVVVYLTGMPMVAFVPLLITRHFQGGATELALVQSALGIGAILGGLIASVWGGFRRKMTTVVVGSTVSVLGWLIVPLLPAQAYRIAVALYFVAAIAQAIRLAPTQAIMQSIIPPEVQGRVFSCDSSLRQASGPLALFIAAPIAEAVGVRPVMVFGALGCLLATALRYWIHDVYDIEDSVAPPVPVAAAEA
ncbi:MAG: MFS transporter [Chloroflexi bacterium]|nr:MFS transporter [Chloroflexota bacterium]